MTVSLHRIGIVAVVLLLAACTSAPPQPKFPQLTYAHLGAFVLDVSEIEIVDAFQPTLRPPNVEHLMPVAPAAAARQWAQDRLQSAGSSGRRAVFTIDNGAVTSTTLKRETGIRGALTTDQSERYDGVLVVRLEIIEATGRRVGLVAADSRRTKSVSESITLNDREKVWYSITKSMADDLNTELQRTITQLLGAYLR